MNAVSLMYDHFSRVAPSYRQVRTTDVEPIVFVSEALKGLPEVKVADVGCGCGRYDLLLLQYVDNLHLTCIDINESMLEATSDYLRSHNFTNFRTIKADAETIPLEDDSMDGILTFNAIHHFDFVKFLERANRAVNKDTGRIFIYTRSRSQNARSIWGQCFPLFCERETRLHELHEMERWIQSVGSVKLETAITFKYGRRASLEELVEKARARHYSTFSLYDDVELDDSLATFQQNVAERFADTSQIEWFDENVLLILKPG